MVKQPQRVFGSPTTNSVYHIWLDMCREHNARRLKNGENPQDYPNEAIAFETLNFGWILSKPINGIRRILVQY